MAGETDIGCLQCRESLWIGKRDSLFFGELDMMKDLESFLNKHKGHVLVYDADESPLFQYMDWEQGRIAEFSKYGDS